MRHCARDLDGFGFWSDNGQPFNNPTPALASNFLAGLHWKRHGVASCSSKMISFSNINKQYGKQLLFVDASFQLNPGEKVGLVGPNGAGKTTLFRMVVGEETPDDTYCAWLDETGAPVGVQQKLMRHAHVSTNGPVRQRLCLGQAQGQSAHCATPLAKACQSRGFHSINKGNCISVPLIGQFWTVAASAQLPVTL